MYWFDKNIIITSEKLPSFSEELKIWGGRAENWNFAEFPLLNLIVL